MSVTEAPAAPAQTASSPQVSRTELEASGAVPLLCLFAGAAVWLLLGSLLALLNSVKTHTPLPEVHIRGDRNVRFQAIGRVVLAAQKAGVPKVGFITEPRNGMN